METHGMADPGQGIFDEVARIEKQADEVLGQAQARARQVSRQAKADVSEIVKAADRDIEQAQARLADQYKARTDQALTQIDVEFLKQHETLDTLREGGLSGLVAWTAEQLSEHLAPQNTDGD